MIKKTYGETMPKNPGFSKAYSTPEAHNPAHRNQERNAVRVRFCAMFGPLSSRMKRVATITP
jgi:hypothetical protein